MAKITRLAIALALAASPAFADPSAAAVEEAKAHFKTGTELYDENNFRGALVELQRACDLAPSYKILFNIAQVDMELQNYAGALTAYGRYLREGGSEVPPERVAQVSAEIDRLRGRVGQVTIQTAAGAEILIDAVSVGYAPLPEAVTVNTGRHEISIHAAGHPTESRVVDVAGQQQLTVVIANEAAPAPPLLPKVIPPGPPGPTVQSPPTPPSKVPMIVAGSAAGALAIVAIVFAFSAHSDQNQLATLRTSYPVTRATLDAKVSDEKRAAGFADGFGIAALVGAGVGAYLTLHYLSASRDYKEHNVQLAITPTGAAIAGTF